MTRARVVQARSSRSAAGSKTSSLFPSPDCIDLRLRALGLGAGEVAHGALKVLVTEELLHRLQVHAALQQPCGKRGAELVWVIAAEKKPRPKRRRLSSTVFFQPELTRLRPRSSLSPRLQWMEEKRGLVYECCRLRPVPVTTASQDIFGHGRVARVWSS
jgi:hypothetical protein